MSSVSLFWSRLAERSIAIMLRKRPEHTLPEIPSSLDIATRRGDRAAQGVEVAIRAPEAPPRSSSLIPQPFQEVFPRAKTHEELIPLDAKPGEYFYSPLDRPTISITQCWCAKCNKQAEGMEDFAETIIGRGGVVCGTISLAAKCHGEATVARLNISQLRKLPIGTRIVLFDQIEGVRLSSGPSLASPSLPASTEHTGDQPSLSIPSDGHARSLRSRHSATPEPGSSN